MGEKHNTKRPRSLILAPVPITEDAYRRPGAQQSPWWTRFAGWVQYYSTQIRWDIERWLARLLHRRWGT